MMVNRILAISGRKGRGKTLGAVYLSQKYDFRLVAFADHLKELSTKIFPFTYEQLHGALKEATYKGYNWSPRDFMVKFGAFMRYWDSCYWINNADLDTKLSNVVIHDLRYKNEADFLRQKGAIIIRLERYKRYCPYEDSNDPSENDLDGYKFDYTIPEVGNVLKTDLYKSLDYVVHKFFK